MRRFIVLAVVVTLSFTVSASAVPQQTSKSLTIRLISAKDDVRHVDLAPKGRPNRGDTLAMTTTLVNEVAQFGRPRGALVGRDVTLVRFLSPKKWRSTLTVHLPGGTLKAPISPAKISRVQESHLVPVTSGTGRFAGARGVLRVTDLSPEVALNVYRLRLP